jgi:hypothetical protein
MFMVRLPFRRQILQTFGGFLIIAITMKVKRVIYLQSIGVFLLSPKVYLQHQLHIISEYSSTYILRL